MTCAFARATLISEDLALLVAHEPPDRAFLLTRVGLVFLLGGAVFVGCIALFAQAANVRVRAKVARVGEAFRRSDEPALDRLAAPERPDNRAYKDYRRYLLETSQVPGGFYSAKGRRQLLRLVVDMMLSPEDPYDGFNSGTAAPRQQLRLVT